MSPSKSTRQQLVKVPQVPCLYRHSLNCGYYGIKKLSGKRKEHSLRTKDRKLAERRLKEWLVNFGKVDAGVGRKLSYEEQELQKLESFNPDAPVRKGNLIWQEKVKRWKVEQ